MQELSQKVQAKTSFAQLKFSLLYEFPPKISSFSPNKKALQVVLTCKARYLSVTAASAAAHTVTAAASVTAATAAGFDLCSCDSFSEIGVVLSVHIDAALANIVRGARFAVEFVS